MRFLSCAPFLRELTLVVSCWVAAGSAQALGYMPWPHVVERVMSQPAPARAQLINHVVNDFDYHPGTDPSQWLTPDELAQRGGGDCKDFALAKFWLLRQAGVAPERVRLAYGHWTQGNERRSHLVVLLWADDGSPLVLDNLVPGLRRLSDRADLSIRFSFDERGFYDQVGMQRIADQPLKGWRGTWDRLAAQPARPVVASGLR